MIQLSIKNFNKMTNSSKVFQVIIILGEFGYFGRRHLLRRLVIQVSYRSPDNGQIPPSPDRRGSPDGPAEVRTGSSRVRETGKGEMGVIRLTGVRWMEKCKD